MNHRKLAFATVTAAAAVTVTTGPVLAGTDTAPPTSTPGDDSAAFCDAVLAWYTPSQPADDEFDEEWFTTILVPLFEQLQATAPGELDDDDVAAVAAALEGGDEAEGQAANVRIGQHAAQTCDWSTHAVSLTDYAFDGVPATVTAGVVAFDLTNDGEEAHMAKLVRRPDDVTTPFSELLALPEEQQDEILEGFEPEVFLDPGQQAMMIFDLLPGTYALVDELPVGTTSLAELESGEHDGTTPSHADEGMIHEFTVE